MISDTLPSDRRQFGSVLSNPSPLQSACKRVGIPPLTHHDLRHYWATLALEKVQNPQLVAEWLGHRDGGVLVLRRYAHVRNEYARAEAKKLQFGFGAKPAQRKVA